METPNQFLQRLLEKKIRVVLKWGLYYEGILKGTDKYFNLLLEDVAEVDGVTSTKIGETLIRCNNVKAIVEVA